jgi:hypothetical protein
MLSMIGHPSGGEPLMVDVRQSGSGSSEESSLSTHWIDRAIREVERREEHGEDGIVQGGNATTLLLRGSNVVGMTIMRCFGSIALAAHGVVACGPIGVAIITKKLRHPLTYALTLTAAMFALVWACHALLRLL